MRQIVQVLFLVGFLIEIASAQTDSIASEKSLPEIQTPTRPTAPNYVILHKIILEGNQKTLPYIILRELDIQEGDTLHLTKIDTLLRQNRNKIFNTNLFVTVDLLLEHLDKDTSQLRICMQERWYLFPLPIFELSDRNFNEWWNTYDRDLSRTNYGLRIVQENFRGRKEKLDVLLQFGFNQRFGLNYNIPYIDRRQKTGLNIGISYSQNKSVAYQTADHKLVFVDGERKNMRERIYAGISLTHRKAFYSFHQFSSGIVHTWVADTVLRLNPAYFLHGSNTQRYLTLSYRFRRDKRDIQVYPLQGKFWEVGIEKNGLFSGDDLNNLTISGAFSLFQRFGKRWAADSQWSGQATFQNNQPYANAQAIGYGENVMRGYELYVIDGQGYGLSRNSLKFEVFNTVRQLRFIPISQFRTFPVAMYLIAFSDFAYIKDDYFQEKSNFLTNKLIYSAGFGADFVTFYNLVLRFSYAWNSRGEGGFFFNFRTKL